MLLCGNPFADGQTALKEFPRLRPDVVLLDLLLPEAGGPSYARHVENLYPRFLELFGVSPKEYREETAVPLKIK
jgi:CheY-like chemotaxis protein